MSKYQNDMSSFKHSFVNFRNTGEIKASIIFSAHGELRIPYMEDVLLGISIPPLPFCLGVNGNRN